MQIDVDDDVDSGDPDGDFTDGSIFYAVLDRKYDVIAMMSDAGVIRERVRYSPYGVARHQPGADITGDGMVNGTDQVTVLATWGAMGTTNYSAASDFDRDGDVDGADLSFLFANWSTTAEPEGVISRIGNTIGYSGYVYDDAINMSLARFRWYDAEMGRWMTRDPVLYLTSSNLYGYVASQPLKFLDPSGLSEEDPDENCDNSNNDDCSDNNLKKLCRLLAARERNNCDNQRLLNKINQMTLVGGATAVGSASTGVAGAKARRAGYSRVARASRTRSDLTNRLGNAAQRSLSQGQAHKAGSILNKTGKAAEAVGKSLGVVGVVVDGASAIHSVKEGDLSGAGISAASGILGVITFIYPPTAVVGVMSGVGLIVIDAAVVGPARSAHNKANTKLCDALDDALLDHAKKNPGCSERIGECK